MPSLKSKRSRANAEQIEARPHAAIEAFEKVKLVANAKFDETIDCAISLGVDPRKSEQSVRLACVLPNGTGKSVKVAVFAQGDHAKAAQEAGADVVGMEDLAEQFKTGEAVADVVIATPDTMPLVGKLGQILGPKGLMPNPKVGTVTTDPAQAVKHAKGGRVQMRTDKGGLIHCRLGLASFDAGKLAENLNFLVKELNRNKPAAAKGVYLKKISVSSTMGPSVVVDISSIDA